MTNVIQYNDVMIDIETLDTSPDAVVLSIGAVLFNAHEHERWADIEADKDRHFHQALNCTSQVSIGRTISVSTVFWWLDRSKAAQSALLNRQRFQVADVLQELNRFVYGVQNVWANGPSFDLTILRSLYKDFEIEFELGYWQDRDYRTALTMAGMGRRKNKPEFMIEHDPIQDCIFQIIGVQEATWRIENNNSNTQSTSTFQAN